MCEGVINSFHPTIKHVSTARFTHLNGITIDGSGNLFVCDMFNHSIRKIDSKTGNVITFAGSKPTKSNIPGESGFKDGSLIVARFNLPAGITIDKTGNLFVCDNGNHCIRKIDVKTNIVSTIAGQVLTNDRTRVEEGFKDGSLNIARFNWPHEITIDNSGDLFVCDTVNNSIRKINIINGIVTTFAGSKPTDGYTPGKKGFKDGRLNVARFNLPYRITIDSSGNLFVCDSLNHCIRKIDIINGIVSTIAGPKPTDSNTLGESGFKDGNLNSARFAWPTGITIDKTGNLFVCDKDNNSIRKIDIINSIVTTIAGPKPTDNNTPGEQGFKDGSLNVARFNQPNGITIDNNGNLFVCEYYNNSVRKIDIKNDYVSTIAGSKPTKSNTLGEGGFKDG